VRGRSLQVGFEVRLHNNTAALSLNAVRQREGSTFVAVR